MTGVVYKSTGSWYTVKTEEGEVYSCRIKGKFRLEGIKSTNPVAVGDHVEFDIETKGDETVGVITAIADRRNYIVRRSVKLSKQTHAAPLDDSKAAANLRQVLPMLGLNPPEDLGTSPELVAFFAMFLVGVAIEVLATVDPGLFTTGRRRQGVPVPDDQVGMLADLDGSNVLVDSKLLGRIQSDKLQGFNGRDATVLYGFGCFLIQVPSQFTVV